GPRGGRDHRLPARAPSGQLLEDRLEQQDLADADRVEPDARAVADPVRGPAEELLAPPFAVLPGPDRAIEQQRGTGRQERRVDQVEQAGHRGILSRTFGSSSIVGWASDFVAGGDGEWSLAGFP